MNKKGQAALEFMMTYGWAILVVLAAIGALSYFGVLNPTKLTPDTCLASSGMGCAGKPMISYDGTDSILVFTVVNGMGITVPMEHSNMVVSSSLTGMGCTASDVYFCNRGVIDHTDASCQDDTETAATPLEFQDGASMTIIIGGSGGGCDFSNADVVRGGLDFTFQNPQSALTDTFSYTFGGKVRRT
jgi:hypothetical protein